MGPADDYADEADHIWRLLTAACEHAPATLLELGAGPGHMASHLKTKLQCTLTDSAPEMLKLCRTLNPECECVLGDMRTLALPGRFDVVLAQDAIGYMTTVEDLRATIATASRHLRPGGVAIFIPDDVKDTFKESTKCGGHTADDGRALRFLEWTYDPDPGDTKIVVEFALMLREHGKATRVEHDLHVAGLFDRATWRGLMRDAGLVLVNPEVHDPYAGQHEVFVGLLGAGGPGV
jgi:SAM-dependent methyltransferase